MEYQFWKEIFDHMEVELMKLKEKEIGKRKCKGVEGRSLDLSCFIKDIDCNGVSKLIWRIEEGKKKMKGK